MIGLIALDIDGTLVGHDCTLKAETIAFLESLVAQGWQILIITGRTFQWASQVIQNITFPFRLAVQNGAILIDMPSKRVLRRAYLDRSILPAMEKICADEPTDYVLFGGFEEGDHAYYREERFDSDLMDFLKRRFTTYKEPWHAVSSYDDVALERFPAVKCFGAEESTTRIVSRIYEETGLHVPLIKDPYEQGYFVVQVTSHQATKGEVLKSVIDGHFVIAAGDDNNDRSMLAVADVKVVMATAPQDLQDEADVVAPPATEQGVIVGLEEAIERAAWKVR